MQNGAMSNNEEVSLAALKSFQESLIAPQDFVGKGRVLHLKVFKVITQQFFKLSLLILSSQNLRKCGLEAG